jgi:hypothetical protein
MVSDRLPRSIDSAVWMPIGRWLRVAGSFPGKNALSIGRGLLRSAQFDPVLVSPRDVMLVGLATVVALGAALYWAGYIRVIPPSIAIAVTLLFFTLAPGYLLVLLLQAWSRQRYGFLTLALLSTSLGFTWNFLANVIVYITGPNIDRTVSAYVAAVAVGYALAIFVRFVLRRGAGTYRVAIEPFRVACVGICVCLIYVMILHRDPSFFYVDEFIIIRKILSVSSIAFDNIAYDLNDRTTYFFAPFYITIAMVTRFLDVDLFIGYLAVWPFTALISLACIAKLSQLLSDSLAPAAILLALAMIVVLFVPIPTSFYRVDLLPYPDRYSVAVGVLLPLAMFHFFMHVKDRHFNPAMLIGLIYLLVENTFIHAKETIYVVGLLAIYLGMLWLRPVWDRAQFLRTLSVLGMVVLIVAIYAVWNAAANPDLFAHLAEHRAASGREFLAAAEQLGPGIFLQPKGSSYAWQMEHMLIRAGAGWTIVVLLFALPLFVAWVERFEALLFPIAIAAILLITASDGLGMLIVAAVGEPDVMRSGPTIFLLGLIVLVHFISLLCRRSAMLAATIRGIRARVEIRSLESAQLIPLAAGVAMLFAALPIAGSLVFPNRLGLQERTVTGSVATDVLLFTSVILISIWRIRRGNPCLSEQPE